MNTKPEVLDTIGVESYFEQLAVILRHAGMSVDLSASSVFGRSLTRIDLYIHKRLVRYLADAMKDSVTAGAVLFDDQANMSDEDFLDYAESCIEYQATGEPSACPLPVIVVEDVTELDASLFEVAFIEYSSSGVAVRIADYMHAIISEAVHDLPTYSELTGLVPDVDTSTMGSGNLTLADEVIRAVELMYISMCLEV